MIRDVLDVANALADAVTRSTDEAHSTPATVAQFANLVPVQATFLVHTVEGQAFRVTITRELP